jgi:flagellar basal body rod protein FlgG
MVNPAGQIGTSINALVNEFESISHNLANINTAGYKRSVNSFSRELKNRMADPEEAIKQGEIKAESKLDFSIGNMRNTGRPLDLALASSGFFVLETPDGPVYTRNGIFHLNKIGQMIDINGRIAAGTGGPIVVPPNISESQIGIAEDGNIMAGDTVIGKLKIVDFDDKGELMSIGNNCYTVPEDVTPVQAKGVSVRQGFQENSNVKVSEELVAMIKVSRLYEANMKFLAKRAEKNKTIIGVANS